ncbi:hypothetical protein Emag_000948 [Eimeria magna]
MPPRAEKPANAFVMCSPSLGHDSTERVGGGSNCVLVGARFTMVQDGSRMNRIDSCHDSNAAPETRVVDSLWGNNKCLLSSPQPVSTMRLYSRQQKLQIHTPR